MKAGDFIGVECHCINCTQAGIGGSVTRRDPRSGEWLHGYALKHWYDAKAKFDELAKQIRPKAMS